MKSTEVYKTINKVLFPALKPNGFSRTKGGMLGYYKSLKRNYLVIWVQCSQDGFNRYTGSRFVIEIQISRTNRIGDISILRHRIPFFMTDTELETIGTIERSVVGKLQRSVTPYFLSCLAGIVQRWYLPKFESVNTTYNNLSDIWFVYSDQLDVEKWAETVRPILIRIADDYEDTEY